ncbi:alcohol dehydrogenase 2-like [Selaginella moellendorffii]|uniref:alcohol dehydrogenase 2-like n=1 Tax=Selaginella moellendorffii TaxID=88036 RepID=UPI000D1CE274|nr:alcohol dehydrogenase 2-like [Selaginella moellendorffii]|eukprot:XP_024539631.1 alcohol dehydrogenase 2-like [Selaginella moellendorffii]
MAMASAGGECSSTAGKIITCKAAVMRKAKEPLLIEEIRVDPPHCGEVRVKILFTALCHSDVHYWEFEGIRALFPRILGHEAAGIVESVGDNVPDLAPGDHVLTLFTGECKSCQKCKSDKANVCSVLGINPFRGGMLEDGKTRFFSKDGEPIFHFIGTSTFSEYTVLHHGCVVKVNPAAPLDRICLLSCGVTAGLGSVWNVANVEPGSTVAIFGLGTLGMAVAEGARMAGASRVIGIDINRHKLELARMFGVTETLHPADHAMPLQQVVQGMTGGGTDYSFECVGNVDVIRSAIESCHDGGGVCVIGGVIPGPQEITIHSRNFLAGRVLKGSMFGGFKGVTQLPALVERFVTKEVDFLDKFITHRLPLARINEAFELMLEGKSLRCVICVDSTNTSATATTP